MFTRATEPALPPDAYSQGDTIITHDPETVQAYREASQEAAQRGPGRVQQATPASAIRPLPSVGISRHFLGKEIFRLSLQAESLHRQAEGPGAGAFNGNANPYLAGLKAGQEAMRTQARNEFAVVRGDLKKLEALDDNQAQEWAYEHGVR
jgi:hypothetical protein